MFVDGSSSINNGGGSSSNANKTHQNDTLNPYFLHPNENPTRVLVTPRLNFGNYHSWSRSITLALHSKNKLHFINEDLPRPRDKDRDLMVCDRCNTMIISWLNNSSDHEISQSKIWIETTSSI